MQMPSIRGSMRYGFLFSLALMLGSFFLEYGMGLAPCPLCMLQRYVLGIVIILFALANVVKRRGVLLLYKTLILLFAALGIALAGRQIWLQQLPADQVPACGPNLDYMLENMPWHEMIKVLYQGSGDCAEVVFRFLGMSLPMWSLLGFLGVVGLAMFSRPRTA